MGIPESNFVYIRTQTPRNEEMKNCAKGERGKVKTFENQFGFEWEVLGSCGLRL